jgi:hypothetical protein
MIRRGFWLIVGAAGGIMGYRRASSLSRQVSERLGARPRMPGAANPGMPGAANPGKPGPANPKKPGPANPKKPGAVKRHWARETIRFTRDVREGMDLYSARHPREERSSLGRESRRS